MKRSLPISVLYVLASGFLSQDGCDCQAPTPPCGEECPTGTYCNLDSRTCVPGDVQLDTALEGAPASESAVNTAQFKFASNVSNAHFECVVDTGAWSVCVSPLTVTVTEGPHTFKVRAVRGGTVDPTPATYMWTVDATAPDTLITYQPHDGGSTGAMVSFTSNERNARFKCKFDDEEYYECIDSARQSGFAPGRHTFRVYAIDRAGNQDPTPAEVVWTVFTPTQTECGPITFSRHSAIVTVDHVPCLDQLALRLQQAPTAHAVANGHRDATEAEGLSRQRADAVKGYLVNTRGIDPVRVNARDLDVVCMHTTEDPSLTPRVTLFMRDSGTDDDTIVEACAPTF